MYDSFHFSKKKSAWCTAFKKNDYTTFSKRLIFKLISMPYGTAYQQGCLYISDVSQVEKLPCGFTNSWIRTI